MFDLIGMDLRKHKEGVISSSHSSSQPSYSCYHSSFYSILKMLIRKVFLTWTVP